MATSSSIAVRELPLFPLPEVVLFPGRPLPLHIFEFRYRMMMNTVLQTDGQFGVLMWNPKTKTAAPVGCCAEIVQHQRMSDDRFKVLTLGQQRFRLLEYIRTKPYYVGLVEWIEDSEPATDLTTLSQEVETLLKDVVRLSAKLMDQEIDVPQDIPNDPLELSYWVAGNLYGVATEQQALLELQNTQTRLEREIEILTTTRNHLAARTVLKDTFE